MGKSIRSACTARALCHHTRNSDQQRNCRRCSGARCCRCRVCPLLWGQRRVCPPREVWRSGSNGAKKVSREEGDGCSADASSSNSRRMSLGRLFHSASSQARQSSVHHGQSGQSDLFNFSRVACFATVTASHIMRCRQRTSGSEGCADRAKKMPCGFRDKVAHKEISPGDLGNVTRLRVLVPVLPP